MNLLPFEHDHRRHEAAVWPPVDACFWCGHRHTGACEYPRRPRPQDVEGDVAKDRAAYRGGHRHG